MGDFAYGETDNLSFNLVKDPVEVRDLHATLLHLPGLDLELTDLEEARVIHEIFPQQAIRSLRRANRYW